MSIFKETLYLFHDHQDNPFVDFLLKNGLILTTDPSLYPRILINELKKEIYFESSVDRSFELGGFGLSPTMEKNFKRKL